MISDQTNNPVEYKSTNISTNKGLLNKFADK